MRRKEASTLAALLASEPFNRDSAEFICNLLTQGQDKWVFTAEDDDGKNYAVTLRKVR